MNRTRLALAALAAALILAVPGALAAPLLPELKMNVPVRLDARSEVVEATLRDVQGFEHAQFLMDSPPRLETVVAFSQPMLRGVDDLAAALVVFPRADSWSGAWWVTSSAGSTLPLKITVGENGLILILQGGERATSDRVQITYHFAGTDGRSWKHTFDPVPVFDEAPARGKVLLSGAAFSDHARPGLPQIGLVSPWNLLGVPAQTGVTIVDRDGNAVSDLRVGDCATGIENNTEPGCRVPFFVVQDDLDGARIVTWHVDDHGERVEDKSYSVDKLRRAPHVLGAKGAQDGDTLVAVALRSR